ncbi:GNAT family N-acetyltransferase [Bacillus sp. AK031]
MVTLKPMTNEEFEKFLARAVINYADEKAAAGNWTKEEALENSKKDFERLLPDGAESENNHLYTIIVQETNAGAIWLAEIGNQTGYIYDIYLETEHQGKGYGKQAMLEIEKVAKNLGLSKIELHVFAHNKTARNLYEKLNYETTNIIMAKKLS